MGLTSVYEAVLVLSPGCTDNLTTLYRADLKDTIEPLAKQVGHAMPDNFISEVIIDTQKGVDMDDPKLDAHQSAVASFGFNLIENRNYLAVKYSVG